MHLVCQKFQSYSYAGEICVVCVCACACVCLRAGVCEFVRSSIILCILGSFCLTFDLNYGLFVSVVCVSLSDGLSLSSGNSDFVSLVQLNTTLYLACVGLFFCGSCFRGRVTLALTLTLVSSCCDTVNPSVRLSVTVFAKLSWEMVYTSIRHCLMVA